VSRVGTREQEVEKEDERERRREEYFLTVNLRCIHAVCRWKSQIYPPQYCGDFSQPFLNFSIPGQQG
jgi:hypothetical protein